MYTSPQFVSIADFAANLTSTLQSVDSGPILIMDNNNPRAALLSYEEYDSLMKTLDVLSDSEPMAAINPYEDDLTDMASFIPLESESSDLTKSPPREKSHRTTSEVLLK